LALGFFFMVVLFPGAPIWAGPLLSGGIAFVFTLIAFSAGDSIVLASARARHIGKPDAPQLWNVVEEMAIASGLPMPQVYLIDDPALNAFATGRKPETASVAITTGLLERLDRDELQGVMAHEMSHVGNRDILFATLMAVLVGSIVMISDILLRSLFWGGGRRRRSSDGDGKAQLVLVVVGIALAILAPIFAKILQLAVSRQREYLADATAARLTRNPRGLASALTKLTADTAELAAANRATAHLFIVNPVMKARAKAKGMFSTHPPIEDRVERLLGMAGEFAEETD
ncbi:MAG: M48 family metallopeptidase, partial [Planctomycetota bacterium]